MEVAPGGDTGCALQVFREPVITPSGLSYEQSALQEHLSKARSPCVKSTVDSVQQYQRIPLHSLPPAGGCQQHEYGVYGCLY